MIRQHLLFVVTTNNVHVSQETTTALGKQKQVLYRQLCIVPTSLAIYICMLSDDVNILNFNELILVAHCGCACQYNYIATFT